MFFYQFNTLENYIENDFLTNIELEEKRLSKIFDIYQNRKTFLSNITTNLISVTNNLENDKTSKFYEAISIIKDSFEELDSIFVSINSSKDVLTCISMLCQKDKVNNLEEIKANLVEYNKKDEELYHKILEFENLFTLILDSITPLINIPSLNMDTTDGFDNSKNIAIYPFQITKKDNKVLTISEKDQKAYLPYQYSEISKILNNHPDIYSSIQDVINRLYTISLDDFKNSSFSRFRESFNLIRNKEHGSITKALDLGLELMFKYDLNPIIITACKNLDELDIYLDCLEQNELDDFDCFEVKFEVAPTTSNK